MFRLTACARVSARSGSRLKTAAPLHMLRFRTPGHHEVSRWWPFRFDVGEIMRLFITIAAVCAAFNLNPAFAQNVAQQEAVRIEIDQQTKAFIFIIDDEPVAMLDKAGLHVVGEVNFGATLADTGPEHINKQIASSRTEAADD